MQTCLMEVVERDIIFLVGDNGKCSLLNWQLKFISAKTLALCDAVDDAIFLQHMITELLFNNVWKYQWVFILIIGPYLTYFDPPIM